MSNTTPFLHYLIRSENDLGHTPSRNHTHLSPSLSTPSFPLFLSLAFYLSISHNLARFRSQRRQSGSSLNLCLSISLYFFIWVRSIVFFCFIVLYLCFFFFKDEGLAISHHFDHREAVWVVSQSVSQYLSISSSG